MGPDYEITLDATLAQGAELLTQSKQLSGAPPVLAGYTLHGRLGAGTFGEAWSGTQVSTGQKVAVKVFARHQAMDWNLFRSEVQRLIEVAEHPNVVTLLDANLEHTPPFFVMPLLNGSLGDLPTIAETEVVATWLDQICQGLAYIHAKGILHGDLKPANLLLDGEGRARLADFGQSFATQAGGYNLGTLGYMPPEQILRALGESQSAPSPRWDIYALGATAYRILSGEVPRMSNQTRAIASSTMTERLQTALEVGQARLKPLRQLNPKVDAELAAIIEGCLEPLPTFRYPDAPAVLEDLQRRRARLPLHIKEPWSLTYRMGRLIRRNPAPLLIGALSVVLLGGSVSLGMREVRGEKQQVEQRKLELNQATQKLEAKANELKAQLDNFQKIETGTGLEAARRGEMAEAALWWASGLDHSPQTTSLAYLLAGYQYPLEEYRRPDVPLSGLLLSPDGKRLVTIGEDGRIEGQSPSAVWHRPGVAGAALGAVLYTGNEVGQVLHWPPGQPQAGSEDWLVNPARLTSWKVSPAQRRCALLLLSPNGRWCLCADAAGGLRFLPRSNRLQWSDHPVDAAFSQDSRRLCVVGKEGRLTVLSVPDGQILWQTSDARQARLNRNGSQILWVDSQNQVHSTLLAGGSVRHLGKGRRVAYYRDLPLSDGWLPGRNEFSADGSRVASIQGNRVRVYDSRTRQPLSGYLSHSQPVQLLAMSADGRQLATYDGAVRRFSCQSSERWKTGPRLTGSAFLLGPKGRIALQQNGKIVEADVHTGQPVGPAKPGRGGPGHWLYDGTQLQVNDQGEIIKLPTGALVTSSPGHLQIAGHKPAPLESVNFQLTHVSDLPVGFSQEGIESPEVPSHRGHFQRVLPVGDSLLLVEPEQITRLVLSPTRFLQEASRWPLQSPLTHLVAREDSLVASSADGLTQVWQVPQRHDGRLTPLFAPLRHPRPVRLAAANPNCQLVATVDLDNQFRVWLTDLGLEVNLPPGLTGLGAIQDLQFDDENRLWVGTQDGRVLSHQLQMVTAGNVLPTIHRWTGMKLGAHGERMILSPEEWAQL